MNAVDFSTGEEGHLESTIRHVPCSLFGLVCNYMASLHLTEPANLWHSNIASTSCNLEYVSCIKMNHCRCWVLTKQTSSSELSSKPSSSVFSSRTNAESIEFWVESCGPKRVFSTDEKSYESCGTDGFSLSSCQMTRKIKPSSCYIYMTHA